MGGKKGKARHHITVGEFGLSKTEITHWTSRVKEFDIRKCFVCHEGNIDVECSVEESVSTTEDNFEEFKMSEEKSNWETECDEFQEMGRSSKLLRRCSMPGCDLVFHESCFLNYTEGDFVPRMHILDSCGDPCLKLQNARKWICPQHECNFCHQELLRTRSQEGPFLRCVACPLAWHRSCVIIGSQHIERWRDRFIMCPRHCSTMKETRINLPYCFKCYRDLKKSDVKIKCNSCVRAWCDCYLNDKDCQESEDIKHKNERKEFTCDFCICVDFPRIGEYVMAASRRSFWPAKTLHADEIPESLFSSKKHRKMVQRLEQAGYVLIQWVEGLEIPNYDVMSFRDLAPLPTSPTCSAWSVIRKRHQNIIKAVEQLYEDGEICFGRNRPLPPEIEMKSARYQKIENNINGRLARHPYHVDQCQCVTVDGRRCTRDKHSCINRSIMAECPANCGLNTTTEIGLEEKERKMPSRNCQGGENSSSQGVCMNNFLRLHRLIDDTNIMEERMTESKGFGVFAKVDLPAHTPLTEYVGRVVPKRMYIEKLNLRASFHNLENSYYGMELTKEYYLDARNCGNMSRCVNHSCAPNCAVESYSVDGTVRLLVSTIRDVQAGEELSYDYATQLDQGMVGTECFCGAPSCRGVIGKPREENRWTSAAKLDFSELDDKTKGGENKYQKQSKSSKKNKIKGRSDKDRRSDTLEVFTVQPKKKRNRSCNIASQIDSDLKSEVEESNTVEPNSTSLTIAKKRGARVPLSHSKIATSTADENTAPALKRIRSADSVTAEQHFMKDGSLTLNDSEGTDSKKTSKTQLRPRNWQKHCLLRLKNCSDNNTNTVLPSRTLRSRFINESASNCDTSAVSSKEELNATPVDSYETNEYSLPTSVSYFGKEMKNRNSVESTHKTMACGN